MSVIPAHDRLGEFLLLLETTNGRDKLCRLIQYTSKAMKWRMETTKQSEEKVKMWHELMASMSLVRKVLRFFRSIAVLRALRAAIPSDMSKMDSVLFFNILAKFCLANYFFWDHFSFAHKVGAWKPKDQKLVTLTGQLAEGSWLAEIVLTLIENLIRLQKLSSVDPSPAVDTARNAALRSIFRNLCDAPLACHFLGIEPFKSHPHGHFGVLGAASSAVSLWEMWPQILVATPSTTCTHVKEA